MCNLYSLNGKTGLLIVQGDRMNKSAKKCKKSIDKSLARHYTIYSRTGRPMDEKSSEKNSKKCLTSKTESAKILTERNTHRRKEIRHNRKDKTMKIATCCHCGTTSNLHRLFSPSRFYFSVCPDCAKLNTGLAAQMPSDETLEVRAVFPTDADAQFAHDAVMGQFPSDAAIRVESIRVEQGNNVVFSLLVPTDRRCDAAKALDTFQSNWNAHVWKISGTRFEFPVMCADTMELRKRQKFCRDHRNTVKYPSLRNDH